MKFVVPITVDSTNLTTDVANTIADWSAGTYTLGDQAVVSELAYEVVVASTTDEPTAGAALAVPSWIVAGYANEWRMWREGTDSISSKVDDIETTVEVLTVVTTVAVLNVDALSVTVEMTDPTAGTVYDETQDVADIDVPDWWEYFFTEYPRSAGLIFEDLPAYYGSGVDVIITVTAASGGDTVSVGRVVIGRDVPSGQSLQGVKSRNLTFSQKVRDEFGGLTLTNRRTIRVVDFPVMLASGDVDSIQRTAATLSATPTLFIGDSTKPETVVFGVLESFDTIINGLSVVECSISVEEF